MYSLKYFLFNEIDVYMYSGATVKLSVSESNPGSLCKTKWQQWCYWCQNRGDKENARFFYDFTKVIINLQWNPSDDFWGCGRDNYWVFGTRVLYYLYIFPRRVLNIRRKIYSIMKGNQSTVLPHTTGMRTCGDGGYDKSWGWRANMSIREWGSLRVRQPGEDVQV